MVSIDDRTGNVITTVAVFAIVAAILYLARGAVFILVLSLLLAYLLEPSVMWVRRHSPVGRGNRNWAIAQVYLAGILVLGTLGYEFGPVFIGQLKSLNETLPQILGELADGKAAADFGARQGLNAPEQQKIHDWLARHSDFINDAFERGAASAANVAANAIWLFVVPILSIFILRDGRQMAESIVQTLAIRHDQRVAKRVLGQIDAMLAEYVRAQLTLAALSLVFYSAVMLILGFPFAIALGVLGGVLEFLPAVGWILSAAVILTIGLLTHSHWIWMAALLLLWRLIQSYVNSPRIMGNNLQLQPLTVLVVLMVGGQVGGIAGLYLSVPIAAVVRIVWLRCFSQSSSEALSESPFAQVEA